MRFLLLILSSLLLLFLNPALGQNLSNLRSKSITVQSDTISLDTLSVIPSSFKVSVGESELDSSKYELEWYSGKLIVDQSMVGQTIKLKYRVFPSLYSEQTFNKDPSLVQKVRIFLRTRSVIVLVVEELRNSLTSVPE